ncbi:hypothetical protein NJH83_28565 [Pseudomonas chlororaphis]|uniref:hypothetical protein n=1 Tax=Pseudomonas chlororaphis TaxID=587753 RepID=UPI00209B5605|nr:hypothetical protein [Pseudomonas chlororaphis]MCO7614198.1 hypothetical protein [Pseudomonas chlororaphis]
MPSHYRFCLFGMALLSSLAANAAPTDQELIDALYAKVQARQDWQAQARQCPGDNMPARTATRATQANRCETPEQLGACLQRCEAGDGNDCYWLATTLQQAKGPAAGYEPLYQRACGLGLVPAAPTAPPACSPPTPTTRPPATVRCRPSTRPVS